MEKISWDYLLYVLCRFKKVLENSLFLSQHICNRYIFLAFFHRGSGECPLRQSATPQGLLPPNIWSENNRKISITKEIHITIDFPPEKIPRRQPALGS